MPNPFTTNASIAPPDDTNTLVVTGKLDATRTITTLVLPDGRQVQLPTALFDERVTGLEFENQDATGNEAVAFPIIEEQLVVGKKTVETAKVRLEKKVHEYQETLDVPLAIRSFDIERIVLNHPVDVAPPVRQEGDTTIYPLIEEQLILTTQLILKEELRVTRRDTERRDTRTITLKRESIDVTRTPLV